MNGEVHRPQRLVLAEQRFAARFVEQVFFADQMRDPEPQDTLEVPDDREEP